MTIDSGVVLVTGGSGFIGKNVVTALLAQGRIVRVLDTQPLNPRIVSPNLSTVVGSVSNREVLKQALKNVVTVIHLAGIASVELCNKTWSESSRSNYFGFTNLLTEISNLSRETAESSIKIIYASSASVYGDNSNFPLDESLEVMPKSVYGFEKKKMEEAARLAGDLFGLETYGLRFFNVYGPGQDPKSPYSGVISRFAKSAKSGTIEIFGDGNQTRDFIYIDDVVVGILAAEKKCSNLGPIVNLCSGIESSINQISQVIVDYVGNPCSIVHHPPRATDIRKSLGSIQKAQKNLNFKAEISLTDGIRRYLSWLEQAEQS